MSNRLFSTFLQVVLVLTFATTLAVAQAPQPLAENSNHSQLNILYTGRLMGYFRLPSKQHEEYNQGMAGNQKRPLWCGDVDLTKEIKHQASSNAVQFITSLNRTDTKKNESEGKEASLQKYDITQRVLVGTGDNFALYLPSRVFEPEKNANSSKSWQYSKDQFNWDWTVPGHWAPNSDPRSPQQAQTLQNGWQVIPTDNVACFLSYAGYDAIVPGRHDFYYGAERVRSLARLLAAIPVTDPEKDVFHPVQMLAANLAITTSWASGHEPIPDSKKRRLPFIIGDTDQDPTRVRPAKVSFPEEGSEVLPWLSAIEGKLSDPAVGYAMVLFGPEKDPDAKTWDAGVGKSGLTIRLEPRERCWSYPEIDTEKEGSQGKCDSLARPKPTQDKTRWLLALDRSKYGRLDPGNYRVCVWKQAFGDPPTWPDRPECVRFTVLAPFLQFTEGDKPLNVPDSVPQPYLCKKRGSGSNDDCTDVAIFGVVDPDLPQQIGELNASWITTERADGKTLKRYKTALKVIDPAKSLKQLIDYMNDASGSEPHYKVLLAQMSSPKARQLAARLKRTYHFNVVVSEYDPEQYTRNQITIVDPTFEVEAGKKPQPGQDYGLRQSPSAQPDASPFQINVPSFIAVPPPLWDEPWSCDPNRSNNKCEPESQNSYDPVRFLQLTRLEEGRWMYKVNGARADNGNGNGACCDSADRLAKEAFDAKQRLNARQEVEQSCENDLSRPACAALLAFSSTVIKRTVGEAPKPGIDPEQAFRTATLAALLKTTHADVALLQRRDFYFKVPIAACLLEKLAPGGSTATTPELCDGDPNLDVQKFLDVLLWKGDLVTVLPVRGSVLQAMMKQSKKFQAEDDSGLSLSDQEERNLVTLGIENEGGEYRINDLPLDPARLYTVVTSDYLASGDTGYPDLNDPGIQYMPRPMFSGKRIQYISSSVCETYQKAVNPSNLQCAADFKPGDYFDKLSLGNRKPLPGTTGLVKFRQWSVLQRKRGQRPTFAPADEWAQKLPAWRLSLDRASVGFTLQRHSDSDVELNNTFGGINLPQATAASSHSWNTDEQLTLVKSYSGFDFITRQQLQYVATFTADKSGGPRTPNQSNDLLSLETGTLFHLGQRRKTPYWGISTTGYAETQPFRLIQSLNVPAGGNPLQFKLPQSYTAVGRAGIGRYYEKSYFRIGLEAGGHFGAFNAFNFFNAPDLIHPVLQCPLEGNRSLQSCVSNGSTSLSSSSLVQPVQEDRYRSGIFWYSLTKLPVVNRVTASLENQGQFFFNNSGDNSSDTRIRHMTTGKISFPIVSTVSLSPTYQFFFFENKVANKSLWQQQALLTIDYSFDWTNWRVARSQLTDKTAQKAK